MTNTDWDSGRYQLSYRAIVGELVRRLRVRALVTQSVLGDVLTCATSNVSRIESGRYPLSVDELRLLCSFFGLLPFQLVRAADVVAKAVAKEGIDVPNVNKPDRIALKAKEMGIVFVKAMELLDVADVGR